MRDAWTCKPASSCSRPSAAPCNTRTRRASCTATSSRNNVLVTEVDGVPQPKVIDFGIAKAVEEPLVHDTPRTRGDQWMGTPAFMAPEQLQTAADVDTRADVYSLGALLHVLLVGDPPFRSADSDVPWPDRIRDERPPRASSRVGRHSHRARPGVTSAALSRELDWVIARCLEKEPDRRYDSAAVLGNELERVMQGEPVLAGPPGVGYRLHTFVRRNRVSLAVAGTIFVVLFVALLFALDREERARDAEAHALEELTRSRAVATLTEHMLLSVKPSVARGADTSLMVEMLERAEQYIIDAEDHAPQTEADLTRMVGGAWWELGEYQRALPHFERSLELRRASLGDDHPDTLSSALMLGAHLLKLGDATRAAPLLRECFDAYSLETLNDSEDARQVAESYSELLFRQGDHERALEIRLELVDAVAAAMGPRHSDTLRSRNNLAISLEKLDRLEAAEEQYRGVLELQLSDPNLGPTHPTTLMTRSNLSGLLRELGRLEAAREMSAEVLEAKREVLPPGHISLLTSLNNLGELETETGNMVRAEELYREALELAQRNLDPTSQPTLILTLNLGRLYVELDRWTEAAALLEPVVRLTRDNSTSSQITLYLEQALIDSYLQLGRFSEALSLTDCALRDEAAQPTQRVGDAEVLTILRAEALAGLGRVEESQPLFESAYAGLEATGGSRVWMRRAAGALAAQWTEDGSIERAAPWRERASEPSDGEN
jgi:eukaryotic-like serine/threonine-protein kinase